VIVKAKTAQRNATPSAPAPTAIATGISPSPAPLPRLAYTMQEAAEILGISYISVYRLVQRGLLKTNNALRRRMISWKELQRFANS
jgi:excisionase family DNA binding protein